MGKIVLGLFTLFFCSFSTANVIMFYDRTEWEMAAALSGLTTATNDFSSTVSLFPGAPINYFDPTGSFSISGTSWDLQGGTYNSSEGNLIQAGQFDLGLSLNNISNDTSLFGIGFDTLDSVGRISIFDIHGDYTDSRFCCEAIHPITGFVGILSAFSIQATNGIYREVTIDGIPLSRIDDFSIAVKTIPEPASLALLALGLAGIGFTRKKR